MRWKRVKVSQIRTLARESGIGAEHGEERADPTVKEGRFQGGDGGQAKRTSPGEVGESING